MFDFNNFIHNAWFVGIIGGIISGIIVYYLTSYVLDRKKKSEHKRNIVISNEEVLLVLRPYIAKSGLPSIEQLTAIINSIARRYNVQPIEMKTVGMFYEDLVLDFVSNVYIPDNIKKERIEKLLENISQFDQVKQEKEREQKYAHKEIGRSGQKASVIFGMLSSIVSITAGILFSVLGMGNFNLTVIIICLILLLCVFAMGLIVVFRSSGKDRRFITERYRFLSRDDMRIMNHGTDLNELFDKKPSFIDYFEDKE